MKGWIGFLGCALILLIAAPLQAQTGCTDSPENPTVVLNAQQAAIRAVRPGVDAKIVHVFRIAEDYSCEYWITAHIFIRRIVP